MTHFLIDGYNLIFSIHAFKGTLRETRTKIISYLQKKFIDLKWKGTIVFDGSTAWYETSGLSYKHPLEIAFTEKKQTADEYILEILEIKKERKQCTVVSNDQGLLRHARAFHTKTLSNESFLKMLLKKKSTSSSQKPHFKESQKQVERLEKIFQERLDAIEDD